MSIREDCTLRPSAPMWAWYSGKITIEGILCFMADKMAGYHISYSATELLKDLGLLSDKGNVNKKGRDILASQLHQRFHHQIDGVKLVNPLVKEKL